MDNEDILVDDGDPDLETRRKLIELYKVIVNQPNNQLEILYKHRDILDIPITVECKLDCMCIPLFEMHPGHNHDIESDHYKMVYSWMETGLCRCHSNGQHFEKKKCQKKLIHVAAVVRNIPVVEYWVHCGLSLDEETTWSYYTPLFLSVVINSTEVLKYVIQNGADVNVDSRSESYTPLMEAIVTRKKEIVQILLDNPKLDVNLVNCRNETALTMVVKMRQKEFLPLLIARGADPNHVDCTGFTPLIHAVLEEDDELLKQLLEHGADINKTDKRTREFSCIVKVLLENGANPNVVASDGYSPLLIATDSGSDDMRDVIKLLLENDADVNHTNEQGYAAIHNAAWNGFLPSVNLLLEHGSPHDLRTLDKNTPLTLAAQRKHPDIIDRLLPLNCDLNNKDRDLDTALHYAAMNDDCSTIRRLLRHGADPDVQNRVCSTPLWNAVHAGSVEIVKILLKHNVTLEVASVGLHPYDNDEVLYSEPKTPMQIIGEKCLIELGRMLIESGYNMAKESWLLDSMVIPKGLESNEAFRQYLIEAYSTPQSLLLQSRNFFRKLFGKHVTVKTEALNIPVPLKSYITLKHL
ncbi:ankyrin repeat domain-containing protein 50 isoform X2 [Patella vulgata]|uniref:ankyrin repeat domain-containing protein 50 isoform X2 n=1 Tax=Patella vulgata TaxID=6465 RepID=UPI0024A8854C|nr:ankyrin repeat domain-containing protein 50 isoform X2 [Patella vulgata]